MFKLAHTVVAALLLNVAAVAQTPAPPAPVPPPAPPSAVPAGPVPNPTAAGLESALHNFPPMVLGANVQPTLAMGGLMPPGCPAAGSRIEQKGGPSIEFLGTVADQPDLCRERLGERETQAWFGIWDTAWPGADFAYRALQRVQRSRTGDAVGFDTVVSGPQQGGPPVVAWHDLIRHEGIEEIQLLGKTYKALKLAHYREGFDGNRYRSVVTLWRDLETGLPIYATYQHISGAPELDAPLIPTAIIPAH